MKRNFGLDIIRAVSILLVLISHRVSCNIELGILGVQFFFILSGFLIGGILIKQLNKESSLRSILDFWKRRWLRTLPLYYLILLARFTFVGNPYGWKIAGYFFFLQANWTGIAFFPVSWSLVVEEWFYLIIPLLIYVYFKVFKAINWNRLLICMILLFLLIRFFWNISGKGIILYQFDCMLIGVYLAYLNIYRQSIFLKLSNRIFAITGLIGIVLLMLNLGEFSEIPKVSPYYRVFWYFLISICIAILIPFFTISDFVNKSLRNTKVIFALVTWISILSYSMYLIHLEVFRISLTNIPILNLILQFSLLAVISYLLYVLIEFPFLKLRDNLSFNTYLNSIKLKHKFS